MQQKMHSIVEKGKQMVQFLFQKEACLLPCLLFLAGQGEINYAGAFTDFYFWSLIFLEASTSSQAQRSKQIAEASRFSGHPGHWGFRGKSSAMVSGHCLLLLGNFNMVKKIKDRWIIDTQFVSSEKISSQFACNTTAHLLNYAEIVFYLNQSWIKNTPAFVISAGIFLFKWGHRVLLHYICIIFMDMS